MAGWNNLWHVLYVTNRAIKPGEELTVSYGSGYWSGRQHELKTGYTENGQVQPGEGHEEDADGTVTVVETIVSD
jgi:hypothetical protein